MRATTSRAMSSAVQGSDHDDQMTGDAGANALYGRGGVDQIDGGGGDDGLRGGPGADTLNGGDGEDIADYSARTVAVTVTVGAAGADDGEAGEGDDVQGDVEVVRGGSAGDSLSGGDGANRLNGRGGADVLDGGGGDDELIGMGGGDTFVGGAGVDLVDYDGETSAVTASSAAAPMTAPWVRAMTSAAMSRNRRRLWRRSADR